MKITANYFVPTEAKIIIEGKSYTGNEFNRLVQALRPHSLNDNQQVVLEWLEKEKTRNTELTVFGTLAIFFDEVDNRSINLDVINSLYELSKREQAQVIQAFASWVLEQEDDK